MSHAAALVRTARTRAGLTQAELAQRAGLSQPAVARLERPGSNPTFETLEAALQAAGWTLTIEVDTPLSIDLEQIRSRLALSPAERLATFTASLRGLHALTSGVRRVD